MKYTKFYKASALAMMLALAGGFFSACSEDDLEVKQINPDKYVPADGVMAWLTVDGQRGFQTVDLKTTATVELYANSTKASSALGTFSVAYDAKALEDYNAETGNKYEAFPQDKVNLGDAALTLNAGEQKSAALNIGLSSPGAGDKTYALPLRVKVTAGDVRLGGGDDVFLLFVNDRSAEASSCDKGEGATKLVSLCETGDTNPLVNLRFTLKESGKYMVDMVALFSANINRNAETGKVYVYCNSSVAHILANRDTYIKPLQDKGIKVLLGILGNHDGSGIANLNTEVAQDFARELKQYCDAYGLDGIFFNDEFSDYEKLPEGTPGFVKPSEEACARLFYETKKLMPERLMMTYAFEKTQNFKGSNFTFDGKNPSWYVDYAFPNYRNGDILDRYEGLTKERSGIYSQEFNLGFWATDAQLKKSVEEGYGAHMIFAMGTERDNAKEQIDHLKKMATIFYEDELVVSSEEYKKDF